MPGDPPDRRGREGAAGQGLGPFFRLVAYLRPYVLVLVAAMACSGLYAAGRAGRAWLIQPLMDDVMLPAARSAEKPSFHDWLDALVDRKPPAPRAAPGEAAGAAPRAAAKPDPDLLRFRESLPRVVALALLIVVLLPLSHVGQMFLNSWVLGRVLVDLQADLCRKLLTLPLRFHHGTTRGDTLSRVMNDAQRAHSSLDLLFDDVAQSGIALLVGVGALLLISWQLTIAIVVAGPLVAGVIALFGRRIRKMAKQRQETQGDMTQRLVQILSGIKVIQAFRAEDHEAEAFQKQNLRYFRRSMRVVKSSALSRGSTDGITNAIGIAVVLVGASVVAAGVWGLTIGALAAYVTVLQEVYRPVKALTKGWTKLQEAMPSADRFFELLDSEETLADPPDAVAVEGIREAIELDHVSFSYGREPVLHDVSLAVRAGETLAIVGRTGSGKTTLADLILRFYEPVSGAIRVDGVDLRRIRRDTWLDQIAVVTQEPILFDGSIRDNIRYGRKDADEAAIEEAARIAHVDEFAATLPDGLDTQVGDAGTRLSGGQRQRVTIARAVVRNPSVLIFDEATSSLDARSERYVQEAMERLLSGRTVFVIAHRLSTVRRADRILVLEDGRVADLGSHAELMARGGLYRDLVRLQQEGGEEAA